MEIPKWFPFRKKTYDEKLYALKAQQESVYWRALDELNRAWYSFQGTSEDEIYNLFLQAALTEIARPVEDDQVFDWNNRTYAYINGLTDFENPYGKRIIYNWLSVVRGQFMEEKNPQSKRLAIACTQGLNLLQPPRIFSALERFVDNRSKITELINTPYYFKNLNLNEINKSQRIS